jgi:hypothetical protein
MVSEVRAMKHLVWIAVPMLLLAAAMILAGIGAAGLWFAVTAVGIALVVVGLKGPGTTASHG